MLRAVPGAFRVVAVLSLIAISAPLFAESPRLAVSPGHLAARSTSDDPWRVLHTADALPDECDLRTSPAGVVLLQLPHGTLTLAGESDVRISVPERTLVLHSGRLLLELAEGSGNWTLSANDASVTAAGPVELDLHQSSDELHAALLDGSASLKRGDVSLESNSPAAWFISQQEMRTEQIDDPEWAAGVRAWAAAPPVQGPGQLLAVDAQSGSRVRLDIARYHVNVVLKPPVALVQIDQSFYNPRSRSEEGEFIFNLPNGSSVSRFAMFVTHNELIEGELIDRSEANRIYSSIVRRRRDPAILEQIGDNLFRMRVFPIFARDTKRILLDYTVPLVTQDGQYRFELPLMSDLDPIWDFKLAGTIHAPLDAESLTSTTHGDLDFDKQNDGSVTFEWHDQHIQPPPTFALRYDAPDNAAPEARSFTTVSSTSGAVRWQHVLVTVPPDKPVSAVPAPADVMILADTSSSAGDMQLLHQTVRTILQNLRPRDRFRLGCVDASYRELTDDWLSAAPGAAASALSELEDQFPLGATDLWRSLAAALSAFDQPPDGRRRIVIYVGDGMGTDGPTGTQWAETLSPVDATFSAVQLGDDPQGHRLLELAARKAGGRLFQARDSRDLDRLFGWTLAGLPTPRRIEFVHADTNSDELFYEPSWVQGEALHIYGRRRTTGELTVSLKLADEPEARQYTFDTGDGGDVGDLFTGRLWAQRRLEQLLAVERPASTVDRRQIVRLSQEWSLLSPHTAFLVLESEADYERWNVDRRLRHRYWQPPGALAAIPLPEKYRQAIEEQTETPADRPVARTGPTVDQRRERFEQALAVAGRALDAGEPAQAMLYLARVQGDAAEFDGAMFDELRERARAALADAEFLEGLGLHRSLLDRSALARLPSSDPALFSLSFGGISPEFLKDYPHARELMQRVRPPQRELTLLEFVEFIRQETDLNVLLDEENLRDEGISPRERIDFTGQGETTLQSLMNIALENVAGVALDVVYEDYVLQITTAAIAEERLQTIPYQVADLVRTDSLPSPARIADPLRQLERMAQRRVDAKMEQLIDVDFRDAPLHDVADFFREFLDENVRLDEQNLLDEGISSDERLSLTLKQVPARVALELLLDNVAGVALDWVHEDETVKITTAAIAEEKLDTRMYSMAGIVYEIPRELIPSWQWRAGYDWGGGFGSGGGFGGGGFGGGGFGGGGFGGFGGSGGGTAPPSDAGISFVGPPEPGDTLPPVAQTSGDGFGFGGGGFGGGGFGGGGGGFGGGGFGFDEPRSPWGSWPDEANGPDFDAAIQLLQNETSGPWFDLDGIGGTVSEYPPALTLIVRQTQRVQREIERQLDMLRQLPPAGRMVQRARVPRITADDPAGWHMDPLIEIIQNETEGPWFDLDGIGGTVSEHTPTMTLMIRQTQRVHREIYSLLAELRRMRYVAERYSETGRLEAIEDLDPFRGAVTMTWLPTVPRLDGLPDPRDGELALLNEFRSEFSQGSQEWTHDDPARPPRHSFTVSLQDGRLQLDADNRVLRADGDHAAAGYPGLRVVEFGEWGEAIRRLVDARLPWMPHRSNVELARMFLVSEHARDDETITIRLGFPASRESFLLATFDRTSDTLLRWEAHRGGELVYRLRFDAEPDSGSLAVVVVNPNDNELERWSLLASSPEAQVAGISEGWDGYVYDDPDREQRTLYRRAREAIQEHGYTTAAELLREALDEQPDQPVFALLLAWIHEYSGRTESSRNEQRDALERVVRSGASDLVQLITRLNFPSFSDRELYFLLREQPAADRSAGNWAQLSRVALAVGRDAEALEAVEQAVRMTSPAEESWADLNRERIHLLLVLQQFDRAVEVAGEVEASRGASRRLLTQLGDLFGAAGRLETADDYSRRALAADDLDENERYGLLTRQARWHSGPSRWRLLLEAAELLPPGHNLRANLVRLITQELGDASHAGIAAELAGETESPDIATALKVRQAELTVDRAEAADIAIALYRDRQLPADRLSWLMETLLIAQRHQDVIEILEQYLRRRVVLQRQLLTHLGNAYRAAGRTRDAVRVTSDSRERL